MAVIRIKKKAQAQAAKPAPKRMPGQKADLTQEKIVAAAISVIDQGHVLNARTIAKTAGVTPGAIYSHFHGAMSEILPEIVRTLLAATARPPHPNEAWDNYLGDLFVAVGRTFHKKLNLAAFVAEGLSNSYLLNPLLVERLLFVFKAAGFSDEKAIKAVDIGIANLIGYIAVEHPSVGASSPAKWLQSWSDTIHQLPADEYPQIAAAEQQLIKIAKDRADQLKEAKPSEARAHHYAACTIAAIKALTSAQPY